MSDILDFHRLTDEEIHPKLVAYLRNRGFNVLDVKCGAIIGIIVRNGTATVFNLKICKHATNIPLFRPKPNKKGLLICQKLLASLVL